jgi:hypothetical protein
MDKFVVKRARRDIDDAASNPVASDSVGVIPESPGSQQPPNSGEKDIAATPLNISVSGKSRSELSKAYNMARTFKDEWTTTYPWLTFDKSVGKAFCVTCQKANELHLLDNAKTVKAAFIIDGFNDWKHAIDRFSGHEKSDCHRCAVTKVSCVSRGQNIACAISKAKRDEMVLARSALSRVISTLMFLGKQGLPIRGKTDSSSNFMQLLTLRASDVSSLNSWLSRTQYRWISHDIQNELLQILGHDVLRRVLSDLRSAEYYSIMLDETTDCGRHEQLVMCYRYCDSSLEIHEVFVGFHDIERQDATTLFNITKDILMRHNIDIKRCRGQCYDGAGNVAGHLNGLQAKVREVEPRALFVHCAAHSVNLVVQDAVKSVSAYRDIMNMFGSLLTYIRDSPKRLRWFESLQMDEANAIRPFCPTRWVLRESALTSVIKNYRELWQFLDEVSDTDRSEIGAKASGFVTQMCQFSTYFNLSSLIKIFTVIGTVNQALQSAHLHLQQANELLSRLKDTLQSYRDKFAEYWHVVVDDAAALGVDAPDVPRVRRAPRRLDDGAQAHHFQTPEDFYRQQYIALIDAATAGIEDRFKSSTWNFLSQVESAFIKQPIDTTFISNFYGSDLDADRLQLHVGMFHDVMLQKHEQVNNIGDIVNVLKNDSTTRQLLPELTKAVRLILTLPVTTCTAERSFSGLRRLKTYLRSTMTQGRLNNIALLNFHKSCVETIDVDMMIDEFVSRCAVRRNTFATK